MKKWITSLTVSMLTLFTPVLVFAGQQGSDLTRNDALRTQVGITVRSVLNPWIGIAAATMILTIIAGAGIMILGGADPRMRTSGKSLVIGSGITIALLLSTYAITALFLEIFGIYMF